MKQEFQRTMTLPGVEAALVWEFLHDASRVAACSPHVDDVNAVADARSWRAVLSSALGPFHVSAPIVVEVLEEQEQSRLILSIRGEDRAVGTRLSVDARGTMQEAEGTLELSLLGAYEVTGRVANLGAAVVRRQAETMITVFWQNLADALRTTAGQSAGGSRSSA